MKTDSASDPAVVFLSRCLGRDSKRITDQEPRKAFVPCSDDRLVDHRVDLFADADQRADLLAIPSVGYCRPYGRFILDDREGLFVSQSALGLHINHPCLTQVLCSGRHGMDDSVVLGVHDDGNLENGLSAAVGSDVHPNPIVLVLASLEVAEGVKHVLIENAVLARAFFDLHPSNLGCVLPAVEPTVHRELSEDRAQPELWSVAA